MKDECCLLFYRELISMYCNDSINICTYTIGTVYSPSVIQLRITLYLQDLLPSFFRDRHLNFDFLSFIITHYINRESLGYLVTPFSKLYAPLRDSIRSTTQVGTLNNTPHFIHLFERLLYEWMTIF